MIEPLEIPSGEGEPATFQILRHDKSLVMISNLSALNGEVFLDREEAKRAAAWLLQAAGEMDEPALVCGVCNGKGRLPSEEEPDTACPECHGDGSFVR